jgi:hypothetical protein
MIKDAVNLTASNSLSRGTCAIYYPICCRLTTVNPLLASTMFEMYPEVQYQFKIIIAKLAQLQIIKIPMMVD